jgi:hypothetical protein
VDTIVFNLLVQCDSTDTKITLGDSSNSEYEFNFLDDTNTFIIIEYSHRYCGTPSIAFTDESGTELTFFSASVSGGAWLILTALPQSIHDVGIHNVKIAFKEPRV